MMKGLKPRTRPTSSYSIDYARDGDGIPVDSETELEMTVIEQMEIEERGRGDLYTELVVPRCYGRGITLANMTIPRLPTLFQPFSMCVGTGVNSAYPYSSIHGPTLWEGTAQGRGKMLTSLIQTVNAVPPGSCCPQESSSSNSSLSSSTCIYDDIKRVTRSGTMLFTSSIDLDVVKSAGGLKKKYNPDCLDQFPALRAAAASQTTLQKVQDHCQTRKGNRTTVHSSSAQPSRMNQNSNTACDTRTVDPNPNPNPNTACDTRTVDPNPNPNPNTACDTRTVDPNPNPNPNPNSNPTFTQHDNSSDHFGTDGRSEISSPMNGAYDGHVAFGTDGRSEISSTMDHAYDGHMAFGTDGRSEISSTIDHSYDGHMTFSEEKIFLDNNDGSINFSDKRDRSKDPVAAALKKAETMAVSHKNNGHSLDVEGKKDGSQSDTVNSARLQNADSDRTTMRESAAGTSNDTLVKKKSSGGVWRLEGPLVVQFDSVPKQHCGKLKEMVNQLSSIVDEEKKKGGRCWRFQFKCLADCRYVVSCMNNADGIFDGNTTRVTCYCLEQGDKPQD